MSVDFLYFAWWLDDEGHPWIRHECADGVVDEWRAPPPWHVTEEGHLAPSLDCKACGKHTILWKSDRIETPSNGSTS